MYSFNTVHKKFTDILKFLGECNDVISEMCRYYCKREIILLGRY